ncbi:MAG: M48 family metalloprotease [Helicobacteraceae bacterium]|nr:M48 family metalloprotease [Helicobacteraceae bacterium]
MWILSFLFKNAIIQALPLGFKALILVALVIFGIIIFNVVRNKIILFFVAFCLFCVALVLLINSLEQIYFLELSLKNALNTSESSMNSKDSIASTFAYIARLNMYPFSCVILVFVAISAFVLFILTRKLLGKQTAIQNDFWENQNLAKSKILWLNILFFIMLFLIFLTAFSLFEIILHISQIELYPRTLPIDNYLAYNAISLGVSFVIVLAIFFAYLFKSILIAKHSIDNLAKSLNATEITDSKIMIGSKEKELINIIEEMAIASTMPMPRVFIMKDESGINAMCSGEKFGEHNERIAIFVTQGAIDHFSRDEMQGVIGHEFSHAFHNDVALNLKIFSFIFALGFIMLIGEVIMRSVIKGNKGRRSSKDGAKGIIVIVLFALVFYILGFVGNLFAQIIQAAISKQKEFLADASSVQYTRNPRGIKSALQKLFDIQTRKIYVNHSPYKSINATKPSIISNPNAKPCAHMFFLKGFDSIFATHPPLEQRIKALEKMGG